MIQINTCGNTVLGHIERPIARPVGRIYFINAENVGRKLLTLVRDASQWVILQDSYGQSSGSGARQARKGTCCKWYSAVDWHR